MSPDLSRTGRARRRACVAVLLSPCVALLPQRVQAGAQVEEPLADSVRSALAAAVNDSAPPKPVFENIEARLVYLRWLGEMSTRLRKRITEPVVREDFLETLWYQSKREGLEPSLMLGLVQVESGFRQHVVSKAGARGYTQVMPFWARLIGDGDERHLFKVQANLAFGCVILRHYLNREKGDMYMALGRYNGSRGRPEYPNAVFAAQRLWVYKPPA